MKGVGGSHQISDRELLPVYKKQKHELVIIFEYALSLHEEWG